METKPVAEAVTSDLDVHEHPSRAAARVGRGGGLRSAGWLRWLLQLGDVAAATVGLGTVALLAGSPEAALDDGSVLRTALLVVATTLLYARAGLYRSARSNIVSVEVASIARTTAAVVVLSILLDVVRESEVALLAPVLGASLVFLVTVAWRSIYRGFLRSMRSQGRFVRPVVLVGIDAETARLQTLLADHVDCGFRSVGVYGNREDAKQLGLAASWAGPIEDATDRIETGEATGVIVVASALSGTETTSVVRAVRELGGHVHLSSGLAGLDHRALQVQPIVHEPLLHLAPTTGPSAWQRAAKRTIDITISAVGLLVLSPVLAVAAIAVKLGDGGSVLFRQERVGRDGATFRMLKLRTMVVDAEDRVGELEHLNLREGPLFKIQSDPRVTRIGRLLRATDLDEVPQLFNVLKGEMSLVGPRPSLVDEYHSFSDDLKRRTHVKPGVTGLWQVESRDAVSFGPYQRLDLFYVDNWSVSLDLVVLLLTFESKLAQIIGRSRDDADSADTVIDLTPISDAVSVG